MGHSPSWQKEKRIKGHIASIMKKQRAMNTYAHKEPKIREIMPFTFRMDLPLQLAKSR